MWHFCNPLLGPESVQLLSDTLPEVEAIYRGDMPHILISGLTPGIDFSEQLLRTFVQQFSFDEDWRRHSIGNLLQYEQVKWLCEEGFAGYDMGPVMDYKFHWTEQCLSLQSVMMVNV